ncbi:nitrate reductase [Alsobacter metallidurans]|uniref:Nitrate reductase n=1 Tax=Alsobacter metallidurans TaxID=340221 RepID=A0A917I5V4_9HYPH|nr:SUMF1/EgtB/PvdO family nonheme iron enzyme [Alsobacter metallidurans]GGH12862.1 nitrate reductase [Alsobacter metallidurans]
MLLILKAKLAAKAALVVAPLAVAAAGYGLPAIPADQVAVTTIAPGAFLHRLAGDFALNGRPVNAPRRAFRFTRPLTIMTYQVSAAAYDACVAAGACERRLFRAAASAEAPAVGVNWHDATAYATWFSSRTGARWRLPTDAEWAFAAGARFNDDAVLADDGSDSFSKRWLAKYEQESSRQAPADKAPRPAGAFGFNEHGVADIAGNVWEWTDTCFLRQALDASGEPTGERTVNCGVRVVEGEHRSYVTDFVRDARAGGCAVGVPPANLGFRLVRDDAGYLGAAVARARFHMRWI